ncbi:MAG: hypothetical protein ACRDYE_12745 [Acidimicrobiales bacterium]
MATGTNNFTGFSFNVGADGTGFENIFSSCDDGPGGLDRDLHRADERRFGLRDVHLHPAEGSFLSSPTG